MWFYFPDTPALIEELRKIARTIAEADHIVPLKPGETRPSDYYCPRHYLSVGRKPLWLSKGDNKKAK